MENVLINHFIQINGTRQNEDSPRQGESFQSHIPAEITFSEQTFLTGFQGAGRWQNRGQCRSVSHLTWSPPLCPTEPVDDFCKQIGKNTACKKQGKTSVPQLQKLHPHLLAGSHRAAVGWDTEAAALNSFPNTAPATPPGSPHCGTGSLVRCGTDPLASLLHCPPPTH